MPTTSKYLKLWLILLVPIVIWLMWRGFVSIFTGGGNNNISQQTWSLVDSGTVIWKNDSLPVQQFIKPILWSPNPIKLEKPETLRIAVPDWFNQTSMDKIVQTLKLDNIIIKWTTITGANYHDQLWKLMASGSVDLSLIATDRANDCGKWCALAFDYAQSIDQFLLSRVVDVIYDSHWTMIPYGLDPMVTYHRPKYPVSGSRGALFNDILINTNDSAVAGSLPLTIGIGAADKALLRSGKEPYPWYTEIIHQMMIQFGNDQSLLEQLTTLGDATQLRSYPRMTKAIDTIADKFPICRETVAACLVRFTVSHYGFGYLTDLIRLPPSRQSTITYDQFPIETNYYPLRLRWFVINKRNNATVTTMGRFISVYMSNMVENTTIGSWSLGKSNKSFDIAVISPFVSRFETQWYNPQYANIIRYTDSFQIIRGGRSTSLDRARNGWLMSVLEGNSSIQVYLSQQGIN